MWFSLLTLNLKHRTTRYFTAATKHTILLPSFDYINVPLHAIAQPKQFLGPEILQFFTYFFCVFIIVYAYVFFVWVKYFDIRDSLRVLILFYNYFQVMNWKETVASLTQQQNDGISFYLTYFFCCFYQRYIVDLSKRNIWWYAWKY